MNDHEQSEPEQATSTVAVLEHRGYWIRLRRTQFDWIGFVTSCGQRPTVILAPTRDAVIAKAHAWVKDQMGGGEGLVPYSFTQLASASRI